MPGPDLRINARPMGVAPMGPPVVVSQAPVVNPSVPQVSPGAPSMPTMAQQAAAAIDYNSLRGFATAGVGRLQNCRGCNAEGMPSLADIAPPSFLGNVPKWALVLGGLTGVGLVVGLVVYFARR